MSRLLLLLLTAFVAATANVAMEPGIYMLKCMDGPGKQKYMALRSSKRGFLTDVAQTSGVVSVFGGSVAGAVALASSATMGAAAAIAGIAFASTGGGVAAAVVVAIPILKMLKSDVMVLSQTRKLQFDLQPSYKAPNGFTLKTRISRSHDHGNNFISPKKKNGVTLQQEEGATFVATRTPRNNFYLQVVDSETPKWLVARLKKIKLHSTKKKKAWKLIKLSEQSSSVSTDGSSIEAN